MVDANDLGWNLRLDPPVLDGDADSFFTAGQCWALAEVFFTDYGWPTWLTCESEYPSGDWDHAVVEHPSGHFFDVNGVGSSGFGGDYRLSELSHLELAEHCWESHEHSCIMSLADYRSASLHAARAYDGLVWDMVSDELTSLF